MLKQYVPAHPKRDDVCAAKSVDHVSRVYAMEEASK